MRIIQNYAAHVLLALYIGAAVLSSYIAFQVFFPASVHAANIPVSCVVINHNMSYGATDAMTNGEVSTLQTFLLNKGYFHTTVVGVFGPVTLAAVQSFQNANGLPSFGYAGPMTRALIQQLTCGTNIAPTMQSIAPTSGAVGTVVLVYGSGFTNDNVVFFGSGALRSIPSADGTTLSFTIPNAIGPYCAPNQPCPMYMTRLITPGPYAVHIQNANGSSNSITFMLTDGTRSGTLSVTGLDAPSALTIGQSGTWTVHATVNGVTNSLHYSVVWGDEQTIANGSAFTAPGPMPIQTNASFTHTYQHSGTYTSVFTVTDDAGDGVSTSSTITVNPLY